MSPSFRRLTAWAIGPCLPAWVVLLALALFHRITWNDALIGSALIFVVLAAFTLKRLKDFDGVIGYAEALLMNPEAPPPELHNSATAARLQRALLALRELWSERRDQAEGLARSRQYIIDALPDPLLLLDRRRRVRGTNAAARELFAFDLQTAVTQGGRIVADRDLTSLIRDPKILEAVDASFTTMTTASAQVTLPAPVERTFRVLIVPLGGDDDTAMIISLTDQTEMIKVERMRADFVANASHELRTPLAAVLGFIETLRGPAKDDPAAHVEFLEIMFKQASRMARLIDDLLSLSRIELREHTRPAEPVDVALIMRATVELLQPEAARRGNHVVITASPDLPRGLGDAGELGQVFSNLLANALKYGGENSRVEVGLDVAPERPPSMPGRGPCLKVAVRDYGEGIAREHIPRLTERFYRVDNARSRALGGTGLGLAIVKHIALRHRGALTIESTEGQGSTFTIWLPIAAGRAG